LQVVESNEAQDKVLFSVNSKELLKYGWPNEKSGSLKSLSAAYLSGFLIGKKSKNELNKRIVLDTGLIPSTKGSRVYAVVKGLVDSGIEINFNEKVIPKMDKIEKLEFFNNVKETINNGI
jgi:large subunit ribosomal protein L18